MGTSAPFLRYTCASISRAPVTSLREIISVTFSRAISSQRWSRTVCVVTDPSFRPGASRAGPFRIVENPDEIPLPAPPLPPSRTAIMRAPMRGTALSNGKIAAAPGLTRDDLLRAYRTMVLSRKIDDKEIQLKNQSLIFFQISGAGHEAVLTAAGMHLRAGYDWFYPYYRDRALCLTLGMTSLEMLLSAVGAKDDPNSRGRQMPSHWGHKRLNIPSQVSPTGTQCLQAVGAGEAGMMFERITSIPDRQDHFHPDEITYVSIGEGATSEGEFWESLNTACTRNVPVLYLIEDNGYAISVPVEVQTAGGDISRLVESFPNLKLWRCDGP